MNFLQENRVFVPIFSILLFPVFTCARQLYSNNHASSNFDNIFDDVTSHTSPMFFVAFMCFICAAPLVVVFGIFKKLTELLGGESSSSSEQIQLPKIDPEIEFPQNKLKPISDIYDCTYYKLMNYQAIDYPEQGAITNVVVKTLKDKFTNDDLKKLSSIPKNRYIVNFLGCFVNERKINLVFDLVPPVNLRDHLSAYKSNSEQFEQKLNEKSLITYAIQIAKGLQHLAKHQCFHPDLAACNILLNENEIRIANYEYPGNFSDNFYLEKKRFLWLAPESCTQKMFDEQANVWSFGILLWEIFTLGATPYPGNSTIRKYSDLIKNGQRMEKPKLCNDALFDLMKKCWEFYPDRRPNLQEVLIKLNRIADTFSDEDLRIPNNMEVDVDDSDGYDDQQLPSF